MPCARIMVWASYVSYQAPYWNDNVPYNVAKKISHYRVGDKIQMQFLLQGINQSSSYFCIWVILSILVHKNPILRTEVPLYNTRNEFILKKSFNIIKGAFLFCTSLYLFCGLRYAFEDTWAWKVCNVYHVYEL